jgi:hypothetical protein
MGSNNGRHLVHRFREGDVDGPFASIAATQQELQREGRLPRTRSPFNQVHPVRRQTATQQSVETRDSSGDGRPEDVSWSDVAHWNDDGNNRAASGTINAVMSKLKTSIPNGTAEVTALQCSVRSLRDANSNRTVGRCRDAGGRQLFPDGKVQIAPQGARRFQIVFAPNLQPKLKAAKADSLELHLR